MVIFGLCGLKYFTAFICWHLFRVQEGILGANEVLNSVRNIWIIFGVFWTNLCLGLIFLFLISLIPTFWPFVYYVFEQFEKVSLVLGEGLLAKLWHHYAYILFFSSLCCFVTTLFLKRNLGQLIWSLDYSYKSSNSTINRFFCLSREVVSFISSCLILPGLLSLFKARSLGEWTSQSRLVLPKDENQIFKKKGVSQFLFLFIITFFSFSLPQVSPFQEKKFSGHNDLIIFFRNSLQRVSFSEREFESLKMNESSKIQRQGQIFSTQRFKFKINLDFRHARFEFIPFVEISRSYQRTKLNPYYLVYDYERDVMFDFRLHESVDWVEKVENIDWGNPFLNTREYNKSIKKIVSKSLKSRFWPLSFFYTGRMHLRNAIINLGLPFEKIDFQRISFGEDNFLKISQMTGDNEFSYFFYPLVESKVRSYQFQMNNDTPSRKSFNDFVEIYLSQAIWSFEPISEGQEDRSHRVEGDVFQSSFIVDFLTVDSLSLNQRTFIENYTYQYYFRLFRRAIRSESVTFLDAVKKSFERTHLITLLKQNEDIHFFSDDFFKLMDEIRKSIENENYDYFGF